MSTEYAMSDCHANTKERKGNYSTRLSNSFTPNYSETGCKKGVEIGCKKRS